jgi:hypothetical protein
MTVYSSRHPVASCVAGQIDRQGYGIEIEFAQILTRYTQPEADLRVPLQELRHAAASATATASPPSSCRPPSLTPRPPPCCGDLAASLYAHQQLGSGLGGRWRKTGESLAVVAVPAHGRVSAEAVDVGAQFLLEVRLTWHLVPCGINTLRGRRESAGTLPPTAGRARLPQAAGTAAPTCWYTAISKPISVSITGMSKNGNSCVISTPPMPLARSIQ